MLSIALQELRFACRSLLRTRYGEADVTTFIPLNTLMTKEGALR